MGQSIRNAAYSPKIVTDGLQYHIDLANSRSYAGTGTALTSLISGSSGTLTNSPKFSTSGGGALVFTGTEYVNVSEIGSYIFGTSDFSISAWVQFETDSAQPDRIFQKTGTGSVTLIYISGGFIALQTHNGTTWDAGVTSVTPVDFQTWVHVTVTKTGTTGIIYINGEYDATGVIHSDINDISGSGALGIEPFSTNALNGKIATCSLYNKVLTQAEVRQNYNALRGRFDPTTFEITGLFSNSEHGAYYDPDDLTTLYSTYNGTTQVTAVGDAVGRMEDKRTAEVFIATYTSDFRAGVNGWVLGGGINHSGNIDSIGGENDWLRLGATNGGPAYRVEHGPTTGFAIGQKVRVRFTYYIPSTNTDVDGIHFRVGNNYNDEISVQTVLDTATTVEFELIAPATNVQILLKAGANDYLTVSGATDYVYVKNVELAVSNLNHAIQSTAGSRPLLGIQPKSGDRNLFTYTEQYNQTGSWTVTRMTIGATNILKAPDGTLTADRLDDTPTSNGCYIHYTPIAWTAGTYTYSVYCKAGTLTQCRLAASNPTDGTLGDMYVNLSNGAILSNPAGTGSVVSVGDGWYRCILTWTSATTDTTHIYLMTASGGIVGYAADGTGTIYAWGSQFETGSAVSAYQRKTVWYDCVEDTRTRVNLITYSEAYVADLVRQSTGSQSSATYISSPFINILEDATTNWHGYISSLASVDTPIAGTYNYSAVVKKNGRRYVAISFLYNSGNGGLAQFDFDTGTLIYSGVSGGVTAVANAVCTVLGIDIMRISVDFTINGTMAAGGGWGVVITNAVMSTPVYTDAVYAGDITKGVLITQQQVSAGSGLQDYQKVTTWYSIPEVKAQNPHVLFLAPDGVDDYMTILGSASSMKYLHDGTGGFVSLGVQAGIVPNPAAIYRFMDSRTGGSGIGFGLGYNDSSANDRLFSRVQNATPAEVTYLDSAEGAFPARTPAIVSWYFDTAAATKSGLKRNNVSLATDTAVANAASSNNSGQDMQLFRDSGGNYLIGKFFNGVIRQGVPTIIQQGRIGLVQADAIGIIV